MSAGAARALLAGGVTAVALVAVNAVFSFHVWFPAERLGLMLVPRIETAVFLLLVLVGFRLNAGAVGRGKRGVWTARLAFGTAAAWLCFGVIYSGAEAFFLYIYGRSFIPGADIPMVRGGLLLLFGEIGAIVEFLTPLTVVLILVTAGTLAALWTRLLVRALLSVQPVWAGHAPRGWRLAAGSGVLLLVGVWAWAAGPDPLPLLAARAFAAGEEGFRVIERPELHPHQPQDTEMELPTRYTFPGLRDRDIYNIAVESYGYAVFSRPELNEMYRPIHDAFERRLSEAGFQAVSGFLEAPVAGGFSWLAEASFMTGQLINSQPAFLRLIEQDIPSVSSVLQDGGYYTLMVRPGTVHGRWNREAEFYGFSDTMIPYDGDFGYSGPGFSFVPITDQFALWQGHQRIEQARQAAGPAEGKPIYVQYQLVSSHTPFNRIPPYIEDWETLGDGSIYHELDILRFDNDWGRGTELDEGYIASLEYVMKVVQEYLSRFLDEDDNSLIIIWGDHQPQRPIREADAYLSVPLHLLSRDPTLLEPWLEHGLQPGFTPRQAPPHPHMKSFFPGFLEVALPEP